MLEEKKWLDFISKFLPIILIFLIGCGVGYNLAPTKEKIVTKTETKYVEVEGKTKTQIQYIQKNSKSDSDVEINNKDPKVSVNGKQYTFEKLPNETSKFENGKLLVE